MPPPTPVVPVTVDAIAAAVSDLKVASDYAHDAAKAPADIKTYGTQAQQALQAAQTAVKAAVSSGGGSSALKGDLAQLQKLLDAIAPDVQAAAGATTVEAAAPHTQKMVLASRLDLLPLALELVRVNGETGSVTGTVKDTAGKPVAQALVTIEGGEVHTGLLTDANGAFKADGIAAFRAVEVKAYKAGYLYVESHAPVMKGASASVVITIPAESNPAASPKVSAATAPGGPLAGTATAHFSLTATQEDNRIAEDQVWALSAEAGVAYVLRGGTNNAYTLDQALPGLKAGSYTWYFFATTHECDMSNVMQQTLTVQ
ncbi:MAG: carboxypeptidase-like regulatory domain-containing protein [Chloroflexota bacterium]